MTFAQPAWLLAGLLICIILAVVFKTLEKRRRVALGRFASEQLIGQLTRNLSRTRRGYKKILILLSVFFLFGALARPQYGYEWVDVKRKGIDLLFALDTSKSMLAEDIKPNRLKRAHFAILDFVQRLEGDRVGLLPFAGSSFLMCPLTMDYEAFEQSLAAVTTDIIPRGGTNLAGVIEAASKILTNGANHKILIILTDGENLEGDALAMAEKYAQEGLTIYTVGVGTSGGELIPVPGGKGFVKDSAGKYVTSRLDESTLTKLAELTGGVYAPLGNSGQGLETIYQQKLSLIPKEELSERRHKLPIDRFEWPLAAALLFLVIELLLGERRANGKQPLLRTLKNSLKRKKEMSVLLVLLLTAAHAGVADASPGEDAFAAEDYLGAAEYYRQQLESTPDSPELLYNYGVSSYKNNMYDDAIQAFNSALSSEDLELQKKTYFNLGNSHFQKGVESRQGNPQATVEEWKQAISQMDSVIQLSPDDERAKNNREVIQKQLDQLEQQMKDQQNQEDQDQQDNQEGEEGQDKKPGDGDSQQGDGKGEQQDNSPQDEKGGEQQQQDTGDQQQQDAAGQDAQKSGEEEKQDVASQSSETPEPINEMAENSGAEENSDQEQAKQDAIRQQQGKMTKEEAERLLNALKNQEGELNFIPSGGADDNEIEKDW
ncbi:VWA domain-containing protein [Desulforhopalus sp. 52FAK]